jgi:hypothetical protein
VRVCATHGRPASWCAVCERERQDEVEFAVAAASLRSPTMLDPDSPGGSIAFNAASVLINAALRPWRKRRARQDAERAFATKPAEEIAAWRQTYLGDRSSG